MPAQETFQTVDHCKIRIRRAGSGAPLLFLHGAAGASIWLPFMEALSQRFDVIVPEHPGFGLSDTPDWLDNVGDLAYFYLDFIEALGLSNVNLVGASLGGWIAAEIAVRSCARLRSLTLSAAAGIHVKGVRKGDIFMWSAEETARNLLHDQTLAEAMIARQLSEAEEFVAMKNRLTTAKLAWQPRFYDPDLHKWLHRISVPTLLLWGSNDKVFPPPYGEAYAKLIPGSRLEVFPACGHLPQIEKQVEFVASITRFIEGAAS